MSNIHQLKRRINTAQNISKITKAMEMVAASKMKKAQEQAISSRSYAEALSASLQMVASKTDARLHPLLSQHQTGKDVAILISTDKGLCGALNTNLFKAVSHWREQHPDGALIVIGKRGVNFARTYGFELLAQFTELPDTISTTNLLPISTLVMENFLQKKIRTVSLIYTDFINTLNQQTTVSQLLPVAASAVELEKDETTVSEVEPVYIFEPNAQEILEELLPYYVENTIFQALLEGKASEHSARMVAMKNASENAGELMSELKLMFNKSRQENITNELLDITTAILTLN